MGVQQQSAPSSQGGMKGGSVGNAGAQQGSPLLAHLVAGLSGVQPSQPGGSSSPTMKGAGTPTGPGSMAGMASMTPSPFDQAHWGIGQGFNGAQGPLAMGSTSANPQNATGAVTGSVTGQAPGMANMRGK
jgi:hypothetical protein